MNLTREQQAAVDTINTNLQIVACAGSGKTEVITRRIANILKCRPEVSPENIVAFTFTEKTAAFMKERILKALEDDGGFHSRAVDQMYVGTIHGFCYRILNQCSDNFKDFKVLDTVKNHLFVSRYNDKCGMSDLSLDPHLNNVKLFLQCIEKMVDDYDNRDKWGETNATVFEKYRSCLYERSYLDFSLLILETIEQLKNNPAVAEHLSKIKYLVVDEYQDVDDLQEKLIWHFSGQGTNICVVGDDDQTIYQFRGSNADNMIRFATKYPNVTQVKLEQNFRCTDAIVDIADCVIKNNQNRIKKKMFSEKNAGRENETIAERVDSDESQYTSIANKITKLHKNGTELSDIAVLVRKGKFINPICSALIREGIPYATDSAEHFFNGAYFTRFIRTLYILADVNKAQLFECWKEYLSDENINVGYKYLRRTARSGGDAFSLPLSGVITEFLDTVGFLDQSTAEVQARIDDLNGFVHILDDYDEIYRDWQLAARISGVLRFLETHAEEEYKYHSFKTKEQSEETVRIMTVHKSKGLEFHSVFLPNLMEREFPSFNPGGRKYWHVLGGAFEDNKDKYTSDIDDERKLFYVAVTRAKKNLFLSYDLSKKSISTFVREAAESVHLKIERDDLVIKDTINNIGKKQSDDAYEERKRQNDEIYALRKKLLDDVHAMAFSGLGAAMIDRDRIWNADEDELRSIARQYGYK